ASRAGRLDRRTNVLDSRHDRGQRDEVSIGPLGNQPCQCRLAGPGRSPEDHRVKLPTFDRPAQWFARTQHLALTDELIHRARAHAVGERPQRLAGGGAAHFLGVPMTSTPAGGVKLTSSGATGTLRSTCSNRTVAVWPSLSSRIMRLSSLLSKPSNARRKSASLLCGSTSTQSSASALGAGVIVKFLRTSTVPDSNMAGVADR